MLLTLAPDGMNELRSDERILFYPTYARRDPAATGRQDADWLIDIHGIVFRPELTSRKRDLLTRFASRLLPRNDDTVEQTMFRRRFWTFLFDNIGDRTIHVRVGTQSYEVGTSSADGHFRGTVRLASQTIASVLAGSAEASAARQPSAIDPPGVHPRWLDFEAVTPAACRRRYRGQVTLIEPGGVSVISDIDDTIKISEVADRSKLITNVLARRYAAVPGMAEIYRQWASAGVACHFVSASPWQLYWSLVRFCRHAGFPPATYHLKKWRLREPSTLDLFKASAELKIDAIEQIIRDFPGRRFLLVGDSTQKDPEVYGELLRRRESQIALALIRNVPGAEMSVQRLRSDFRDVPGDRWRVFDEAVDLLEACRPHVP